MSFIDTIKGFFTPPPPDKQLDTDSDGHPLFKEDIIRFVTDELDRRKTERQPLEDQWRLNSNFLAGNQYCDINTYSGEVEQVEPVHDWMEHEVFNRIAPLIETRIANLKKIKYLMTVKPATNELDDYAKAETSTAILRHKQNNSDFEAKKNTMILWNELCGNCFWLSWWDKDKGEEYTRDGETVINEGDLDYGLLTPYEIFPESIFKQGVDNQRSIITEQVKTIDDIYDLFGIKVDGVSIDTFALTPLPVSGGYGFEGTVNTLGTRQVENSQKVVTWFEKPNRKHPRGLLIIIIGEEHLVYYGDLPYDSVTLKQVVCTEVAGQFFGKSKIEELIPLQRAYNGCKNRIHEYIKRIVIQGWMAEEGAIDIDDYEENGAAPGGITTYKVGNNPPTPVKNADLPSELINECETLKNDIEYVAAVSQLMVIGATPSGVTSGTAIESLREIDNTRLSLTGDHIRNAVKGMAKDWLYIFKRYIKNSRVIKYVGTNNIGNAIIWTHEDINSYDIEFDTINELEVSEEMQKQRFFEAYNLGLFTDDAGRIPQRVKQKAIEYMQTGSYSEIMSINQLQIQAAQRENVFFEQGSIPEASELDDHQIHTEEHERYMLQMKFQILKMKKPEFAQAMLEHWQIHKQQVVQMQPVLPAPQGV